MPVAPEYLPLAIPHRGFDILLYVRTEDQTMGSAEIMKSGTPVATIAPSPFKDFNTGKTEMTERAKSWIDQYLDQPHAN